MNKELIGYFDKMLPMTLRVNTVDSGDPSGDMGLLLGLPFPYNVPAADGIFNEMYYWDTYFLNTGLILSGNLEQAKNSIENLAFMLEKYGFIPNGNRVCFLHNSQPPFFSKMVSEYYQATGDKKWLRRMYEHVKKEHAFWQEERMSPCGLNHYCGDFQGMPEKLKKFYCDTMSKRVGENANLSYEEMGRGLLSAGESGWDCNPRMYARTHHYAPVDLNSLLYMQESHLEQFAHILGIEEQALQWQAEKEQRGARIRTYLQDKSGIFYDYDFTESSQRIFASAASVYPLFAKVATAEEAKAALALLDKLETPYGIVTCQETDIPGSFQWGYPNGWAPIQRIVVEGLLNYGYVEEARRIAQKFTSLMESCFQKTGHTWEKYDVVAGSQESVNEYEQLPMIGWNYGTYLYLCKILSDTEEMRA